MQIKMKTYDSWWYDMVCVSISGQSPVYMVQRSLAVGCPCLPLPRQPLPQLLWQAQADQAVVVESSMVVRSTFQDLNGFHKYSWRSCLFHTFWSRQMLWSCMQVHLHDLLSLLFVAHLKLQPRVLHIPWEARLWRCLAWVFAVQWYGSSEKEAGHGKRSIGWRKNMQEVQ